MISFIEGKVCQKFPNYLILENGGIGYRLNYNEQLAPRMPAIGQKARLYTYLDVREDSLSLFAFPQYEELQLFRMLTGVNRIGPSLASTIVATMTPDQFALAVINEDTDTLQEIKGIGKKSAQRLIVELKDKLEKEQEYQASPGDEEEAAAADTATGGTGNARVSYKAALDALTLLGYSGKEARAAVQAVSKAHPDLELDELIRQSLQHLASM